MKKTYKKPYFVVESFQLNASIAAGCDQSIQFGENDCGYLETGDSELKWEFFSYTTCEMDMTYADNDGHDTICYHGPTVANVTLINS